MLKRYLRCGCYEMLPHLAAPSSAFSYSPCQWCQLPTVLSSGLLMVASKICYASRLKCTRSQSCPSAFSCIPLALVLSTYHSGAALTRKFLDAYWYPPEDSTRLAEG